jgi:hypothetical protein
MMLLSAAKVARRWESCGEVARRRSGGAGVSVCWARVGDMRAGGVLPAAFCEHITS